MELQVSILTGAYVLRKTVWAVRLTAKSVLIEALW